MRERKYIYYGQEEKNSENLKFHFNEKEQGNMYSRAWTTILNLEKMIKNRSCKYRFVKSVKSSKMPQENNFTEIMKKIKKFLIEEDNALLKKGSVVRLTGSSKKGTKIEIIDEGNKKKMSLKGGSKKRSKSQEREKKRLQREAKSKSMTEEDRKKLLEKIKKNKQLQREAKNKNKTEEEHKKLIEKQKENKQLQ